MLYFNNLEAYDNLLAGGSTPDEARATVKTMDSILKEIIAHFASNKLISILGVVIIGIGSFLLAGLWHLSIDIKSMNERFIVISEQMKIR